MTFKKFADELRVYFYAHLYHKVLFLYNYAAELNVDGHYVESQQIAVECDIVWSFSVIYSPTKQCGSVIDKITGENAIG